MDKNTSNEIKFINFFNKKNNTCFKRYKNKFNTFDAIDNEQKILLEIKFRNINHYVYDSALLGINKLIRFKKKYLNLGYKFYFACCFNDAWLLYEFNLKDEILFKTKSIQPSKLKITEHEYIHCKDDFIKDYFCVPLKLFKTIRKRKPICLIED